MIYTFFPDPYERPPSETGLAPMGLVYTLTDVYHIPRRVALTLGYIEAHQLLARCVKARMINALLLERTLAHV